MAQIPETCEFDVKPDQLELRTRTNGDTIKISGLNLSKEQAAAVAWLVNFDNDLTIEIKPKT